MTDDKETSSTPTKRSPEPIPESSSLRGGSYRGSISRKSEHVDWRGVIGAPSAATEGGRHPNATKTGHSEVYGFRAYRVLQLGFWDLAEARKAAKEATVDGKD